MMKDAIVQKIVASEAAEHAASVFVELERGILSSTFDLADAVELDRPEELSPPEGRKAALLGLMQATVSGGFPEWWSEEIGAHEFDKAPHVEHVGAGIESDEWANQIETWAERVREQHPDIEASDRELASLSCSELYGANLEEYEQRVVALDQSTELQRLVAGNFKTAQELIDAATEEVESRSGGTE